MGQPRASRRKVITVSSDEDEDALPRGPSKDDEPVEQGKYATGKLRPVKKELRAQQRPLSKPAQSVKPIKPNSDQMTNKAKKKSPTKASPKPAAKPIQSFFNAAVQRQRASQPSASPGKIVPQLEGIEAIYDDSDDVQGSQVRPARGSSTALAVRKRKLQPGDSFEMDSSLSLPGSQKFRKASSGERVPILSVINQDKRPWTEQFAPQDLSELAVHKRKLTDVHQWLESTVRGRRHKVLVLKGPAGAGKTTTIRLLAKEMDLEVMEWRNPGGSDLVANEGSSASAQFDDFVARAGKSSGLEFVFGDNYNRTLRVNENVGSIKQPDDRRRLLLVEEFPNTFSRSSNALQSFRSAILQYLASPQLDSTCTTPIVMVISETLLSSNTALADSFTAHRLLGPELTNHPFLDSIEFNAVAPTIINKALETVVIKEARKSGRRRTPGPQVLKRIAESGDVRSAVSSLEFLCVRNDNDDAWSSKVHFTKSKKSKIEPALTKAEEEALKLISNRESTLDIFHAVGKVVYNKRMPSSTVVHPEPWLPQHRREQVPETNVDNFIDELGTDTPTFVAALHENYVLSCSSAKTDTTLDSLSCCINNISDADLLSVDRFSFGNRAFTGSATDNLRQDEMAFQVAVRGLLFSLPYPVHRTTPVNGKRGDAHRMFYPASLRLWKKREEVEGIVDLLMARFQAEQPMGGNGVPGATAKADRTGVEAWKRNTSSDDPQGTSQTTGNARTELLLETLPYVAQILNSRGTVAEFLNQVNAVTRIQGATTADDHNEEEEELDLDNDSQELWTTDRSHGSSFAARMKTQNKRSRLRGTEGGGLAIPVESRVEKLVLEDDDIVDD